ncbi:uncharacterized protein [Montipora capricornis]|uniref:uncharacterized protein n=1 Tax=Montipora capricornis TaxID=246305 RepID=UPI0035F1A668
MAYEISIEGVQIKGYHHFKIKAPTGTPLVIRPENNEHDPFALACHIPNEMDQIPESLRTVEMLSKSQKKKYTLQAVLGSQIGRVQYFLNRELSFLLKCGKITSIQGTVRGEPTITARPTTQQKFHKNKQAGGGAFIPASLKITGPQQHMAFVLERLRATLHECENRDEMSIDMLKE